MMPSENGVCVFDADTQETSYGICFLDGLPYIFDTHRMGVRYVATIELLTEVVEPVRVSRDRIRRFRATPERAASPSRTPRASSKEIFTCTRSPGQFAGSISR